MKKPSEFHVLVVEDDETLRMTITAVLKRRGFNVMSAEGGIQTLRILQQSNRVDLVVSDVRMPEGDGISLLENIRAKDKDVPIVILVTGFADVSEADCIKKGAHSVLAKPISGKALSAALMGALGIPH